MPSPAAHTPSNPRLIYTVQSDQELREGQLLLQGILV
ncbi:hypothetical protein ABIB90_007177 [Bradyrhizobium sp. JR4.1]